MPIRVTSFDFDGCLFNGEYKLNDNNIIESNKKLLDLLQKEKTSFSKAITFIGCRRQSRNVDYRFSNTQRLMTGSCFPKIREVSDYIESELDTFLLADVYGDLKAGTSYELALKEINGSEENSVTGTHHDWLFDDTKATILYAQMHKVANENPDEEIIFNFYDDRIDILPALEKFFTQYPEMIPPKVTLSLYDYRGQVFTLKASLRGNKESIIDTNYRLTVKEMGRKAFTVQYPSKTFCLEEEVKTADFVNAKELEQRRALGQALSVIDAKLVHEATTEDINDQSANSGSKVIELIKDSTKKTISSPMSPMNMQILGGFIAAIGCTAVAIAFVALNAATFGIPGLVAAGLGATLVLSGVGLFATGTYKNYEVSPDIDSGLGMDC